MEKFGVLNARYMIGEQIIGKDKVAMILGDIIYYGSCLTTNLKEAVDNANKGFATMFG